MEKRTFNDGKLCKKVYESDGFKVFEPQESIDERVMFFEEMVGERIQEWLEDLPIDGTFKRFPTDDDIALFEGEGDVAWVFSDRGMRLYESYLSKATRLGRKLFPDEELDIDRHTGVFTP